MTTMTVGRKARRMNKAGSGKRAGLLGAAAVTAAAMTVGAAGVAPNASAFPSAVDATTTGPLLWLAGQLGLDSIQVPLPGVGDLTVNLNWTNSDAVNLYDAINAAPFGTGLGLGSYRPAILSDFNLAPLLIASGTGTTGAIDAYRALLASAAGNTPEGFTPLTAGTHLSPNITNLPMILVRNLGTPNGGINARFSSIFELFGINSVSPEASSSHNENSSIKFAAMFANIALGYDFLSDFPATANLFSLANSVMSLLPTNLLGGVSLKGADEEEIGNNLIGLLLSDAPNTSYSTLVPNDFALLEPLRLPARLINLALQALGVSFRMPTLLADALTPITKILVNIGYTDVVTPEDIANDPEQYAGYSAYDRTFLDSGTPTPWLSQNPLTPSEWAAVPHDLVHALIDGFLGIFTGGSTAAPAPAAALAPKAAQAVTPAAVEAAAEDSSDAAAGAAGDKLSGKADDDSAAATSISAGAPSGVTTGSGKSRKPSGVPGKSQAESSASSSASDNAGSSSRGVGGSKRAKAASSSDAA